MNAAMPEYSFEEAVARLEAIVAELDSGQLSLEESLRCFEEGVALQRHCITLLTAAQRRVELLGDEAAAPLPTPVPDPRNWNEPA